FFFFSSRRRHTRFSRDWSSDVCSSDLADKLRPGDIVGALTGEAGLHKDAIGKIDVYDTRSYVAIARASAAQALARLRAGKIKGRSEERRVGKECRTRWWPDP